MTDLIKRLSSLSPEKLALFQRRLTRPNPDSREIPRRQDVGPAPLSFAQERLWFLQELLPEVPLYHIPTTRRFTGSLDLPALQRSLDVLVHRHEGLRTRFPLIDGRPWQVVAPSLRIPIRSADLRDTAETEREAECERRISDEVRVSFDLANGPLLRAILFQLADDDHLLLLTVHHIVADGWSIGVLWRELTTVYDAERTGRTPALPELPIQYADYAVWQRQWLQGDTLDRHLTYWRDQLAGAPDVLNLPTDRSRAARETYAGAVQSFTLPISTATSMKRIANHENATLFMALLATFKTLLFRYTGEADIVIGSPIANRNRAQTEGLLGCFVNALALRTDLSGNPTFRQLLRRVRETTLGAYAHQDLPFEKLVEDLQPKRSLTQNPLFQALFALQNTPDTERRHAPSPDSGAPRVVHGTAKFDLSLSLSETEDGLSGAVEYSTDLFDHASITRMIGHLETLLTAITDDPEQRLSELPILTAREDEQLRSWNATVATYPGDASIHHLFESQVEKSPDAVAVVLEGERISYRALNHRANQIARFLRRLGVDAGTCVGICMERSVEMVASILGVLKARGAYVPLDPSYPPQRLEAMVADGRIPIVLAQERVANRLRQAKARTIAVDSEWRIISGEDDSNPSWTTASSDLAYVIFTSGSTGRPKGAGVSHRGFVNLLTWFTRTFHLHEDDKVLVISSFSFDLTQKNLLAPLTIGAPVHMMPSGWFDPDAIRRTIAAEEITIVNCTPSAFYPVADGTDDDLQALRSLTHVFLGGEPISMRRLESWLGSKHCRSRIVNTYGPTECTDVVSYHIVEDPVRLLDSSIPIGRPVSNVQLYVLDQTLARLPIGVVGELYIGGEGVGLGYVGRADLTAERFIPDAYGGVPGARLYRTGDLARYLPDGNIDFVGRVDHQVKLRGMRIELGEIEAVLAEHPAISAAAVLVHEGGEGDGRLRAFLVPDPRNAGPVHNLVRLEREGVLTRAQRHELPNGMVIAHLNRSETDFVYRELFEEEAYLRHGIRLRAGACVFDVGANIGLFALYVSRKIPDAQIFAFEPIPPIFDVLKLNMTIHGLDARLFEHGVASETGAAEFTYYPHVSIISGRFADGAEERQTVKTFLLAQQEGSAGMSLGQSEIEELLEERLTSVPFSCPMKTLSQVIRENQVDHIDLLKIDVEKSELDVMTGIEDAHWPLIRQVVLEVHDSDHRLERIQQLLAKHGYDVTTEQERVLRGTGLYNLYAIRQSDMVPVGSLNRHARGSARNERQADGWSSPRELLDDVRAFLNARLPSHMVPPTFVILPSLPLGPNGKVDRLALPELAAISESRGVFVAPRSPLEQTVADIWVEVLGLERIGVGDDFFELGGHSLLATQVVSRIREAFHIALPLRRLFEQPTIEGLAMAIVECLAEQTGGHETGLALAEIDALSHAEVAAMLGTPGGERS